MLAAAVVNGHVAARLDKSRQRRDNTCSDETRRSERGKYIASWYGELRKVVRNHIFATNRSSVLDLLTMSPPLKKGFMKNWFAVEATPIFAIVGIVIVGGTWYLTRLARGPTVVWTKENPTPWNDIKPNEGTKMLTVNQHFEKGWERKKL